MPQKSKPMIAISLRNIDKNYYQDIQESLSRNNNRLNIQRITISDGDLFVYFRDWNRFNQKAIDVEEHVYDMSKTTFTLIHDVGEDDVREHYLHQWGARKRGIEISEESDGWIFIMQHNPDHTREITHIYKHGIEFKPDNKKR